MNWRGTATKAIGAVMALALVALVVGQLLGQPVLLSYVTTGSMEPTIDAGDGFVAVPTAVAGPIEEGDVVVFEAEEIQGGGLTTHRVVEETDRGFVTRGDANPFTDQDSGEPPVRREQIVAVAWQVGGEPVVIPHLGTVAESVQGFVEALQFRLAGLLGTRSLLGTQGLAYLIFGLTVVLYAVDVWLSDDRRRDRSRQRDSGLSAHLLIGVMAASLVLAATAAMVGPAGPQSFEIVSSEFESERSDVIQQGTNQTLQYTVGNGGQVPVYVFFQEGSQNVDIQPESFRLGGNDVQNGTLTLTAPPETGAYRLFLTEHRYLALLPESHVRSLYEVHPWLPIVVIDALIGVPFYVVGIVLVGTGRVRRRDRKGSSTIDRVLARLR
ncbi:signal peptidase I [Halapricum hydrolyticum]|uniref:Signal peptidase I n=1 Tax=Halapricum hydrolyticum TaxID=2979991 RepID=A0AAE3LK21_9EURY|nr:signal peptidase I [Halapricum hydrolyticum]MCU4719009.1 signal peptidase I [Halapricum hydrolyticum]MCU4727938.1 signal peptidase I [Halapricum hydrolyticum]